MDGLTRLWWTAKGVGWDNLGRRLLQAWRVRSGALRRRMDPARFSDEAFQASSSASPAEQPALWAQRAERFLPSLPAEALERVADADAWHAYVITVCDRALAGDYRFFSHWYGRLGWPPDFNLDPRHEIRWPVGEHWLGTARSGPPRHDLKLVWEASRLSLAYLFARAYARDGDERWAEAFWQMLDAWVEQNPPQRSVAWACGQETTFRFMAALFGAVRTLASPAATEQRLWDLAGLAWRFGRSIEANLNAALAQKNNHGISEAVGLWTIGRLFPEFPEADRWRRCGLDAITREVARQVYDDGSFVQHSLNYHRVMMDDCLWALALGRRAGESLDPGFEQRFAKATAWLAQMVDPATGRAPNYGNNDGALVLPLSTCEYLDFRPALQAAWYAVNGHRCFEPGPWDEKMAWLFGAEALEAPVVPPERPPSFTAPDGGYYVLRGPNSWAMARCHAYRDRAHQCDMLHLDLWYAGWNVLRDGGTYMYYAEDPWRLHFLRTGAHNTVEVDGEDQMVKGPRFLWFRWPRGRLRCSATSADGRLGFIDGEHAGYARLPGHVVHRRQVLRIDDAYVVVDDVLGRGSHEVALRWRLAPVEWAQPDRAWQADLGGALMRVQLALPETFAAELVCGRDLPEPEGWESLYYAEKQPVPTLVARGQTALPIRLVTLVNFPGTHIMVAEIGAAGTGRPVVLEGLGDGNLAAAIAQVSNGGFRHA